MHIEKFKEINQNFFKGVLILLVIADHNNFFRVSVLQLFTGLSFHVVGFFYIYLLNSIFKNYTLESTLKQSINLYKTFLIFLLASSFLLKIDENINLWSYLTGLIHTLRTGNFSDIKEFSGLGMLWFLPSFITFMIAVQLLKKINLIVLLLFSIVIFILIKVYYKFLTDNIHYNLFAVVPTIYLLALSYFILAINSYSKLSSPIIIFFCFLSKLILISFNLNQEIGAFFLAADDITGYLSSALETISGVLLILKISQNISFRPIEYIGKNSLKFYIFHPFIGFIFFKLFNIIGYNGGIFVIDSFIYILVILLTFLTVHVINNIKFICKILF